MKKVEISSEYDIFEFNETNIYLKLLNFINENKNINVPISTNYAVVENLSSVNKIFDFLNQDEYIHTNANEVPNNNGGWDYNGGFTYDLSYILLDNDKLLVILQKRCIDYFPGDLIDIKFFLYPNADKFIIKTQDGHRKDKSYINIFNNNDELVSEFYFEMSWDNKEFVSDIPLNKIIKSVSVDYLINKFQNKGFVLSKKL